MIKIINMQLENYDESIQNFELSLDHDSKFINSLFALGVTYKTIKKYDNAIRNFERVISFEPENRMALFEINEIKKFQKNENKE